MILPTYFLTYNMYGWDVASHCLHHWQFMGKQLVQSNHRHDFNMQPRQIKLTLIPLTSYSTWNELPGFFGCAWTEDLHFMTAKVSPSSGSSIFGTSGGDAKKVITNWLSIKTLSNFFKSHKYRYILSNGWFTHYQHLLRYSKTCVITFFLISQQYLCKWAVYLLWKSSKLKISHINFMPASEFIRHTETKIPLFPVWKICATHNPENNYINTNI